jgi:hypothetical protein
MDGRIDLSNLREFAKLSLSIFPMLPKGADQKELNLCHKEASYAPTQSSIPIRFPASGPAARLKRQPRDGQG